jgi:hypothetical protein
VRAPIGVAAILGAVLVGATGTAAGSGGARSAPDPSTFV